MDLSYSHSFYRDDTATATKASNNIAHGRPKQRIVAAKAELANFVDSGVIDGEAAVLKFLHSSLPEGMVPTFIDYVRQPSPSPQTSNGGGTGHGGVSAIIMEYLPGEDMHLLRDRHCQSLAAAEKATYVSGGNSSGTSSGGAGGMVPRRVSVADAVYLVSDVMLPLLKAMHEVGMVHR